MSVILTYWVTKLLLPQQEQLNNLHDSLFSRKIVEPKFGPMPSFPNQRIFARVVMILATLIIVYFTSKNEKEMIFAKQREVVPGRGQNVECSAEYTKELNDFPGIIILINVLLSWQ